MLKKTIYSMLIVLTLNGCASLEKVSIINDDIRHDVRSDRKYMSCDIRYYQSSYDGSGAVYSRKYETVANKSFIYALMSSNAYDDSAQFTIPGWNRIRRYESGKGFSADIWKNEEDTDLVIAYRGTDFLQPQDWIFGNFNIFWKGQYEEAEIVTKAITEEFTKRKITVTGHSLGGGLAIHSSLHQDKVDAIVINASPRVFNAEEYVNNDNHRLILSEKGEFLNIFREKWPGLKKVDFEGPYDEFDFVSDLSIIEHGSYYIARGLTAVAASTGNELAIKVMNTNFGCKL